MAAPQPATEEERPAARSRIAVLPAHLSDQIAAGEVIERPASVVKELAENALDAGASRVEVEIEQGGLTLIRVLDDGCGMTKEEAHLSLLRHATSKLKDINDLFSLRTNGFRGEALPSIAAVSRFTLTTRTADSIAAYRLSVEASRETSSREVGAPVGTQVEVRDLLFNVPARLKFIKGDSTEGSNIAEVLLRLSLAYPRVHFRLRDTQKGRLVLDLPPHGNALERAQAALSARGRSGGKVRLHRAATLEDGVRVEAYIGAPADSASTPRNSYLYVNRRFIRDRSLLHALTMGYGEVLERGRYPLAVLFVELPGDAVDINVHPQKLEVRFRDAQPVYRAVRHAVRAVTDLSPWLTFGSGARHATVSESLFFAEEPAASPPAAETAAEEHPAYGAAPEAVVDASALFDDAPLPEPPGSDDAGETRAAAPDDGRRDRPSAPWSPPSRVTAERSGAAASPAAPPVISPARPTAPDRGPATSYAAADAGLAEHRARLQQALGFNSAPGAANPSAEAPRRAFFSAMSYLGQLHRTYLLCEHEKELVLIDQHAAHESLAFQRLKRAYRKEGLRAQRLLFPLSIELDPELAALCEDEAPALARLGFELRPFGGRSFALTTAPDTVEYGRGAKVYQDPERVLRKVLEDFLAHGSSEALAAREESILATVACHSVVRAGDVLDEMKARALLQSMDEETYVPHCPHGRPVLVRMAVAEIEKRFGRT